MNPVDVDTACHALLSRTIAVTKRKMQRILTDEDDFTAYLYSEFIGAQTQNPVANLRHLPPLFKENVCLEILALLNAGPLYAAGGALAGAGAAQTFTNLTAIAVPPVVAIAETWQDIYDLMD